MAARPLVAPAVDPALVARVVREVLAALQDELPPADLALFAEIEDLARYIEDARREIAELGTEEIRTRHIVAATDELDAIVAATEAATGTILDCAERIEAIAAEIKGEAGAALGDAVTRIYEASNFQDITGQRISKVVKTLKHIEDRIEALVATFGGNAAASGPGEVEQDREAALLNGPSLPGEATTQDEIDKLLASFD